MRFFFLFFTLLSCLYSIGQIPIYQSKQIEPKRNVIPYDSLTNISIIYSEHQYGNSRYDYFRGLIGQKIIFNPEFSVHAKSYMPQLCWKNINKDKMSDLIGKEFSIFDVVSDGILDSPVFVLVHNETGEHFRYSPDACGMEPFLSLGYFEWMVKTYKRKEWWYKNSYPSQNLPCLVDNNTNELISSDDYTLLKCTDVQLKLPQNREYSLFDKGGVLLMFEDSVGNQGYINMGFDNAGKTTYSGWRGNSQKGIANILLSLEQREAEINERNQTARRIELEEENRKIGLIKRYGADKGKMVYLGIVELGMTKEMCIDAIGNPHNINTSHSKNGIFEQWIYPDRYVYFQEEKIVSIDRFE